MTNIRPVGLPLFAKKHPVAGTHHDEVLDGLGVNSGSLFVNGENTSNLEEVLAMSGVGEVTCTR